MRFMLVLWVIVGLLLGCKEDAQVDNSTPKKPTVVKKAAPQSNVDGSRFVAKSVPKDIVKINSNFEKKVILLGYSINNDTVRPGDLVIVTWYWKVLKRIGGQWEFFTHLMDANGELISSFNSNGAMRSTYKPQMWKPGEIIRDTERIIVPKNWTSGVVDVRTGLWSGPVRMAIVKGPVDEDNRAKGPVLAVTTKRKIPIAKAESINVSSVKKAPVIDGKFQEEVAWESATNLKRFVNTVTGLNIGNATNVKVMWDKNNLYLGIHCEDFERVSSDSEMDILNEDAVDIFFQEPESQEYFEIQISASGIINEAKYSKYREMDEGWKSGASIVVSENTEDTATRRKDWFVEIKIPLKSILGKLSVSEGDSLKANIYRIDSSSSQTEYSGWSPPMRGDFHAVDRFGTLSFVK